MAVAGDRLYITARQQGIWIFDIKDPRRPTLIRRFDTVEMATGLAISGDLAVTSERIYGSPIYSVADPAEFLINVILREELCLQAPAEAEEEADSPHPLHGSIRERWKEYSE